MSEKQLWDYFLEKSVCEAKPFDRAFLWVAKDDFRFVQHFFISEFNVVHSGKSFRSRSYFSHIHAVEQEVHVFIHKDFGNIAIFLPLGLVHFVFDVIPYSVFSLVKKKKLDDIFACPCDNTTLR